MNYFVEDESQVEAKNDTKISISELDFSFEVIKENIH
jgi:hypothetical protein